MSPIIRLCAVAGCGHRRIEDSIHCFRHTAIANAVDNKRRNAKWQASGGNTPQWRRLRALVLYKSGHICRIRKPGCTGTATTVHIDPRLNGDHSLATEFDCVAACAHCHGVVDAPRAKARA